VKDLLPWLLDFDEDITKSKDPVKALAFWAKLAWEVTSCGEAAEVFPDMQVCPVCMEREEGGHLLHKSKGALLN
jgi:hypothetical protein